MIPTVERSERLEAWVTSRLSWLAWIPIAFFVVVAFQHALPTYIHPDEGQQFLRADVDSLPQAFRASLTQSHPPFYVLLLYGTTYIAHSLLFLRGISIIAAAIALWLFFVWLRRSMGDRVAITALGLMAGSPGLLAVAPQMRQYGVLLFFIGATLYSLERMLREASVLWTILYTGALGGILFTYYGGAWIAVTLGLYVPLRFWLERTPRQVMLTWAGFQAAAVLVGAWVSFAHLTDLQKDINWAARGFLRGSYYMSGSPWAWIERATGRVFQYFAHGLPLREHSWFGSVLLVLYVAGLVVMIAAPRRPSPASDRSDSVQRSYAVLLLLPVLLACIGGLMKLLPYGGTRHTSYLLPFVIVAAAIPIAAALPRLWVLTALAVITVPLRLAHAIPAIPWARLPLDNVEQTVRYIRENIPTSETIYADRQAFYILNFYLGVGEGRYLKKLDRANESYAGGYRILWPRGTALWTFHPDSFKRSLTALAQNANSPPPAPKVWVVSHAVAPRRPLRGVLGADVRYQRFGAFEVIEMPYPRRPSPE